MWAGYALRHVLTESWAGQLMNTSVIQSIGSLSRQMKAKVLGLLLVDATSSPKMLLRKSLLQQATPFSSDFRVLGNQLATTRVPRSLSNAARETPLPSLKRGSKDSKDVPGKHNTGRKCSPLVVDFTHVMFCTQQNLEKKWCRVPGSPSAYFYGSSNITARNN